MLKALAVVFALAASALLTHGTFWQLPGRHNPWAPLALEDPPNWLTRHKLRRLDDEPLQCLSALEGAAMRAQPQPDREAEPGCHLRNVVLVRETQVRFTEPVLRPVTLIERTLPPIGEVPDDYVAPSAVPAVRDMLPPATQPARPPLPQPRDVPAASASLSTALSTATPSALAASALTGASAAPPPGGAASAASPLAAAVVPPRVDEHGVTQALNQYASAYGRLDAGAARAVWPSVDERALARAFAGLESQNVSFDSCDIDVRGTTANASCRGQASYVGKVGTREPRTEPRQWRFELRRDGDAWKIESAEARRVSAY